LVASIRGARVGHGTICAASVLADSTNQLISEETAAISIGGTTVFRDLLD
jgi:hypothetical protein